jgi:hypothetical protein
MAFSLEFRSEEKPSNAGSFFRSTTNNPRGGMTLSSNVLEYFSETKNYKNSFNRDKSNRDNINFLKLIGICPEIRNEWK